jgi:hypothetical protein
LNFFRAPLQWENNNSIINENYLQGSHNNLTKYINKSLAIYGGSMVKQSYHLPQSQQEFSGSLFKLDQLICIWL